MKQALANTNVFIVSYITFMAPTYYLSYLSAQSPAFESLDSVNTHLFNLPFILHIGAILALLWICLIRGQIIGAKWLALLPMVVFAFEFIPKLVEIPMVPSIYHLLAIMVGATYPIISALNESKP